MLTVFDGHQPLNRRRLLTIGSLGFGGLALPTLFAQRAQAGNARSPATGKSVIFLFQQGGPSQFETYDPKPHAPLGIRTLTDTVQTSLPGILFGDALPRLAKLAHKLTVVRSYQTNNAGHNIQPIVGPDSLESNIGAHYSRVAGMTDPATAIPTNAVIYPASVCDDVPGPQARGNLAATGDYGAAYAPFVPGGRGQLQQDMTLRMPRERFFNDRRQLLKKLSELDRRFDRIAETEALGKIREQAFQLLDTGSVANALDLSRENPKTLAAYDTGRFARKGQWHKAARGKKGYYFAQAQSIGKLLLLARRLCEAGCGFVTIHAGYAGVWDMHADGNNLNMIDGMQAVGRSFDHAVAAFISDVESRGLRDKILLVASGEMGRTPRVNKRGGRDHWSRLAPLLLYGGGTKPGQVIGRSKPDGTEPSGDNLTPKHLIATIMQTLFDTTQLRVTDGVAPQILRLASAKPIPGLY